MYRQDCRQIDRIRGRRENPCQAKISVSFRHLQGAPLPRIRHLAGMTEQKVAVSFRHLQVAPYLGSRLLTGMQVNQRLQLASGSCN